MNPAGTVKRMRTTNVRSAAVSPTNHGVPSMPKSLKEQLEAIRPRIKTPAHGKTKQHKDRKKEEKKRGPLK
jgi:hypothetical protein